MPEVKAKFARFTPEENEYIRENYGKIPTLEIANKCGKNPKAIRQCARKLGIWFDSREDRPKPMSNMDLIAERERIARERGVSYGQQAEYERRGL